MSGIKFTDYKLFIRMKHLGRILRYWVDIVEMGTGKTHTLFTEFLHCGQDMAVCAAPSHDENLAGRGSVNFKFGNEVRYLLNLLLTLVHHQLMCGRIGGEHSPVVLFKAADPVFKAFLTGDRSGDAGLGTKVLVYDEAVARSAAKIIALSTCADAATNGRLVVLARMTERVFETPAPDPVRLTVRYVTEDGRHVFPTQVFVYQVGDSYYVVPPVLPGYTASVTIIRGTITEDMSVVVRYVPVDYTLTVHYVFLNGMEAAKTWTGTLHVGDAYDVRSPEVKGYIPVTQRVRGTNPGRDESYTVIYIPEDADIEKLTRLEDFDIPLGLGRTFMHQGVCVE